MAEDVKREKLKGSDIGSETAARERPRRIQQGAQGAGKEGPIKRPRYEAGRDHRPDHKTSRG